MLNGNSVNRLCFATYAILGLKDQETWVVEMTRSGVEAPEHGKRKKKEKEVNWIEPTARATANSNSKETSHLMTRPKVASKWVNEQMSDEFSTYQHELSSWDEWLAARGYSSFVLLLTLDIINVLT